LVKILGKVSLRGVFSRVILLLSSILLSEGVPLAEVVLAKGVSLSVGIALTVILLSVFAADGLLDLLFDFLGDLLSLVLLVVLVLSVGPLGLVPVGLESVGWVVSLASGISVRTLSLLEDFVGDLFRFFLSLLVLLEGVLLSVERSLVTVPLTEVLLEVVLAIRSLVLLAVVVLAVGSLELPTVLSLVVVLAVFSRVVVVAEGSLLFVCCYTVLTLLSVLALLSVLLVFLWVFGVLDELQGAVHGRADFAFVHVFLDLFEDLLVGGVVHVSLVLLEDFGQDFALVFEGARGADPLGPVVFVGGGILTFLLVSGTELDCLGGEERSTDAHGGGPERVLPVDVDLLAVEGLDLDVAVLEGDLLAAEAAGAERAEAS